MIAASGRGAVSIIFQEMVFAVIFAVSAVSAANILMSLLKQSGRPNDAVADGVVIGRIMRAAASPAGSPWLWTPAFSHREDCAPTRGYAASREAAMARLRQEPARE